MTRHVFKPGEFAYFSGKGEIVRIVSSYDKKGLLGTKQVLRVMSLKDVEASTGRPSRYIDCPISSILPIKDDDVQLMFKLLYLTEEFTLLRYL